MQDFEVSVPNWEGTGIAERVNVKIPERWDEELGEWMLAPEAHKIIEDTKRGVFGLGSNRLNERIRS